jgi:predicted transcriptional regulator
MYGLTKKEKMKFVLEKIKDLEISSYEIGKKTGLSIAGIEKLVSGTVKNPHENTLNIIIDFLESKVLGSNLLKNNTQNLVNEPQEKYNEEINDYTKKYIECLQQSSVLIKENAELKALLIKNNIQFD